MEKTNFTQLESGLHVPKHVADELQTEFMRGNEEAQTGEFNPAEQELKAQREVMGVDGHGSIRADNETTTSPFDNAPNAEDRALYFPNGDKNSIGLTKEDGTHYTYKEATEEYNKALEELRNLPTKASGDKEKLREQFDELVGKVHTFDGYLSLADGLDEEKLKEHQQSINSIIDSLERKSGLVNDVDVNKLSDPDPSTLDTSIPAPGQSNEEIKKNLRDIMSRAIEAKMNGNYQDYLSAMADFDKATENIDSGLANKASKAGDDVMNDTPDGRIPRVSHEDQKKRVENKEVQKMLEEVSDRYAQETAKARHGYLGRFAQGNTWLGKAVRKIPGVSSLVEKANTKFNKSLQSAKAEYDELVNVVGASVGAELAAQGLSPEEIRAISNAGNIMNERLFEERVVAYRNEHTKDTNPLVNFWVNAKSKKGKIAKFGIAAGLGLATGLATGGLAPVIGISAKVGALVGSGLTGGFLGNYINKRRGKAVLRSENEMINGLTLNEAQAAESLAQKASSIQSGEMVKDSRENTLFTEARTDLELADRRSRVRKTVAAAKAGGLLGNLLSNELDFGGGKNTETPDEGGLDEPTGDEKPKPGEDPGDQNPGPGEDPGDQNPGPGEDPGTTGETEEASNAFNVEAGNGFTHEIQDLGTELGVEVNSDTAYRIYLDAVNQFGSDLTTGGEYSMGGNNFGISAPGMTEWNPGVREFLEQQIKNNVGATVSSTN